VTGRAAAERDDPDDFSGIGGGGAALLVAFAALAHPWQAFREAFVATRRLLRRAFRLALTPVLLVAVPLWSRRRDRRPTFEDFLRRDDDGEASQG